ncbi:hypothetical protein K505DRAFT_350231 [Melanomma pulvis-pyrius CBS 109.77]|uniref:Uncharacterized protein n=1 Tax=Melanomma pulvis-pyrius CBS 109.77 TaxID=1314802 RepID=A0A6A6XA60_9PLEO|nr:hypothetical protein K505DRAFT_350231 [Melanomma pulvis-pyrius CBS 109.77]
MARWTPNLLLSYAFCLLTTVLGVAAQYPPHGTSVPVAQVQGPPGYQAFMRKNTASVATENSTLCRLLSPALNRLPSAFGLDVDICRNADVNSTKALLETLKTAVESYLGTSICFVVLSFDDVEGRQVSAAQEALQALGLRQVLPTIRAAKSVVLAHMPNILPGSNREPWVVLAVDYSFHWFNVGLYTLDEIGIVDPIEGTVRGPRIEEDNQLDALRDVLRHLFANPPPNANLPKQIHHLVVAHEEMDTIDFEARVQSAFGCRWRSKLYLENHNEL